VNTRPERGSLDRLRSSSGQTIELFERGGELWQRATWTTIVAGWGGLLLARMALTGIAAGIGAKVAASPTSIQLMLAITLGAQMIVRSALR
jgi:hypothetical protein